MCFRFPPLDNLVLQGPLQLHSFGEIPCNFSETDQFASIISNGGDDHICPKLRTILAYTPALVLEPPFLCGNLQFPLWLAISQIFFGVEAREVFAYNFRTLISLNAFCSVVPVLDIAIGI